MNQSKSDDTAPTRFSDEEPVLWEIQDKVEPLEFTGWRLGNASTARPGSSRWTEITIFRTQGGSWIVQREGKSVRYHRADGPCRHGRLVKNDDIKEEHVPCPDCRPPGLVELDRLADAGDEADYRLEVSLSSADVVSSPPEVLRALTFKGQLTTVAEEALSEAVRRDPELKAGLIRKRVVA